MAAKMFGSSFSCVPTHISSPFQGKPKLKLSSRLGLLEGHHLNRNDLRNRKGSKSCHLLNAKLTVNKISYKRRQCMLFATSEDQLSNSDLEASDFEASDLEADDLGQERPQPSAEDANSAYVSYYQSERAEGKPGFVSFHGHASKNDDEIFVSSPVRNQNNILWFVGPSVLVASFVFPSLYLRRIISTIFEDSLLTDFLILFFTEALFYGGVAIFLLLIDRIWRPVEPASTATKRDLPPHLVHRISSVAILVLSLIIPMVTMGFVWPWTGPAASATLAPYLVGIVVQFAFEQYARQKSSPSWPVIPIIFQVYRLHQLNRAAQLVTALSFTVRGAETTSHNLAINGSLSTLLNVLQFLGIICIWSLSNFIMRYFPSSITPDQ